MIVLKSTMTETAETTTEVTVEQSGCLTNEVISKLRFREARKELESRSLDTSGTLSAMRDRLRLATLGMKRTATKEAVVHSPPTVDTRIIDSDDPAEVRRSDLVLMIILLSE